MTTIDPSCRDAVSEPALSNASSSTEAQNRSLIGLQLTDPAVETPAFVIDDDKLSANLAAGLAKAKSLGVTLRPHLKTHKCVDIARRQMQSPEGPATVSTLAEARVFAAAGVKDLIYAVGIAPQKLDAVAQIRRTGCDLKILLDSAAAAQAVSAYCREHQTSLPVLLEVDVDGHRSGLPPASDALIETAKALTDGASFVGVLTHAGASYDREGLEYAKLAAKNERDRILLAAKRLADAGFPSRIISIGSSPTFMAADDMTGITEVRAGVYALWDLFQANLGVAAVDRIAGSVLCTVIGHQADKGQVITDAGWMALSRDRGTAKQHRDYGYGLVCGVDGQVLEGGTLIVSGANQEHGIITSSVRKLRPEDYPIGARLRILPNHACPACAPYERLLLVKAGRIIDEPTHVRGW